MAIYKIKPSQLSKSVSLKQIRSRIYISDDQNQSVATITLDEVSHAQFPYQSYAEMELELNEIRYTHATKEEQKKMEAINSYLQKTIMDNFQNLKIDQRPKYNKMVALIVGNKVSFIRQNWVWSIFSAIVFLPFFILLNTIYLQLNKTSKKNISVGHILLFALLVVLTSYLVNKSISTPRSSINSLIQFNAEVVSEDKFIFNDHVFTNTGCQSSEESYKGKFSCKCTPSKKYGMTTIIPNLSGGDQLSISLYSKFLSGSARIVAESKKNNYYYSTVIPTSSDWKKFTDKITLPKNFENGDVKVYAFLDSNVGSVFFDEMSIAIAHQKSETITSLKPTNFNIRLTSANYQKLAKKRREALDVGLLFSSKEDLVDAFLKVDAQEYGAKIRLKGDLLDHLQGDKWSFRIQLKGNDEWRDMKTFSIHNSKSRSHVAEWIMHQMFRDEGIITPAYDFLKAKLNDNRLGIYAYEQHFDNNILKVNKRNLGPIFRHTDDVYWNNVNDNLSPFPWSEATQIDIYNKENWDDANFKNYSKLVRVC